MIHRLIELSLRNRGLVIALYLGLAAWGYWALLRTPIDAIPDLSENQVIVFTDWTGRSPQEVEDQVRAEAVKEAKAKAQSLSSLAGVKLARIINVSENSNDTQPRPYLMSEKAVALDAVGGAGGTAAPTNVEPGSTTFSMTVTLSYETL